MIENNSFKFPDRCCDWEGIQMPGFLLSHIKILVTGNFLSMSMWLFSNTEFILPPAPPCCMLFLKPAGKKIEDLNENRWNVSNLDWLSFSKQCYSFPSLQFVNWLSTLHLLSRLLLAFLPERLDSIE